MTRSQRIAIWVLTLIGLLAAWKLFGQGFGNFRTDQPFLARNYASGTASNAPVMIAYFDTRSSTNVILSGASAITNWLNLTNASDPATTSIAQAATWHASGGASGFGYVEFTGSSKFTFYPTNEVNAAYTVAMVYLTLTGDGFGIFGDDSSGYANMGGWFETTYTPYGFDIGRWSSRPTTCLVNVSAAPIILPASYYRFICTIAPNKVQMWTNGVYAGIDTTGCDSSYEISPYMIGSARSSASFLNGYVHRFMMWKGELSSNDCVTVDAQIKSEFGL